jgi:hypothetical protein
VKSCVGESVREGGGCERGRDRECVRA